jgi:hypothetical protein
MSLVGDAKCRLNFPNPVKKLGQRRTDRSWHIGRNIPDTLIKDVERKIKPEKL